MAESLLFSFAESFLGKLASRAVEEASLALGVFNDLQEMKDTVLIIKGVLLDAEQKQHKNHAMRELRQIKRVFNDAEDLSRIQLANRSGYFCVAGFSKNGLSGEFALPDLGSLTNPADSE